MTRLIPDILLVRDFGLFWGGLVLGQLGARTILAANLWQMYELTGSTLHVGFIGLVEASSMLFIGPMGGVVADRMDRRRLLQATQTITLASAAGLALATFTGTIEPWHIYLAALSVSAASTFEHAARQALIPGLVPRDRLVDAFSMVIPARSLSVLLGPSLAGLIITFAGSGTVYLFGTIAVSALVVFLVFVRTPALAAGRKNLPLLASMAEGFTYVRHRPLIWQLMSLDFALTFFAAYRVLLPALARDVLLVGAAGYGFLASAPAAGAILGAAAAYRLRSVRAKGLLVLCLSGAYALTTVGLALVNVFLLALAAAATLGFIDAISTTMRQAVVQLETPDDLRGRVSSVHQMVSRGGPALGQAYMGAVATIFGPPLALTLSAMIPLVYASWLAATGQTVRGYVTEPAAADS